MKLQEYIDTHTLIKWNAIEKELGIPTGTIRVGGNIPSKYEEGVISRLESYGYSSSGGMVFSDLELRGTRNVEIEKYHLDRCSECSKKRTDFGSNKTGEVIGETYIIKNGNTGNMEGVLFKRKLLDDGTKLVVVK